MTSDGGVVDLRAVDTSIGLIERLCDCISDGRHQSYVDHSLCDLRRQRVYQIALGCEDANDCDNLRSDPAMKMACDRLPVIADGLASQPTMSRYENRDMVVSCVGLPWRSSICLYPPMRGPLQVVSHPISTLCELIRLDRRIKRGCCSLIKKFHRFITLSFRSFAALSFLNTSSLPYPFRPVRVQPHDHSSAYTNPDPSDPSNAAHRRRIPPPRRNMARSFFQGSLRAASSHYSNSRCPYPRYKCAACRRAWGRARTSSSPDSTAGHSVRASKQPPRDQSRRSAYRTAV
ncbi:MAG TPA: hypothetical protein EYQ20_20600 [candidate division Zixibacteria bacterium]|nr:hypothetical protein [candidate division Zixibacteria bacterium]